MTDQNTMSLQRLASLQEENRKLRAKLKEREEDCVLAANVGQSLLAQIGTLQGQIAEFEKSQTNGLNSPSRQDTLICTELESFNVQENPLAENSLIGLSLVHCGNMSTPQKPKRPFSKPRQQHTIASTASGTNKPAIDTMVEADLESALLKQLRELRVQHEMNQKRKAELQDALVETEEKLVKLRKEHEKLKTKSDHSATRAWNLEIECKHLHQSVAEMQERASKLEGLNQLMSNQAQLAKEGLEVAKDREQELKQKLSQYQLALEMEQQRNHELVSSLRRERSDLASQLSITSKPTAKDIGIMTIGATAEHNKQKELLMTVMTLTEQRNVLQQKLDELKENTLNTSSVSPKGKSIFDSRLLNSLDLNQPKRLLRETAVQTDETNPFDIQEATGNVDSDTLSIRSGVTDDYDEMFAENDDSDAESELEETPSILERHQQYEYTLGVESLTATMVGSWFQKYNRYEKNPQMRYFCVNPYVRKLQWTHQAPSQSSRKTQVKSMSIQSISWRDPPITSIRNYPPSQDDVIRISSESRTIMVLPLNWDDYDNWVRGISFLLERGSSAQNDGKWNKEAVVADLLTGMDTNNHMSSSSMVEGESVISYDLPTDTRSAASRRLTVLDIPRPTTTRTPQKARGGTGNGLETRRSTISGRHNRSDAISRTAADDSLEILVNGPKMAHREVHTVVAQGLEPVKKTPTQKDSLSTPRTALRRLSMFFNRESASNENISKTPRDMGELPSLVSIDKQEQEVTKGNVRDALRPTVSSLSSLSSAISDLDHALNLDDAFC